MNTELILLLNTCVDIERESATLYHWLSDHFKNDRNASRLWKKTALEEENHESQFLLAKKLAEEMQAVPLVKPAEAAKKLEFLKNLRQELKNNPPDLVRCLEIAVAMEEDLAAFHLGNVLLYPDEDDRKMFEAMMAHDREHAESLKKLLDELTADRSES